MTIQASRFTPEVLLSAPRRSAGIPNYSGQKVLYTVSTYSFDTHAKTSQIRVLDVKTGQSSLVFEDSSYSEPTWVAESTIIFLKSGEKGCTTLLQSDISSPDSSTREIHAFDGILGNLKVKPLSDGSVALVCSVVTTPTGSIYNPAAEQKSYTSAKTYSGLFVRHWDSWIGDNRNELWYGLLKTTDGKLALQDPGLVRLNSGNPSLELESPVAPFGGTSDFDVSESGVVFVSKDPQLCPAQFTKTNLYYVPLRSFSDPKPPPAQEVKTGKLRGYCLCPVFSPDGTKIAFARMRNVQYESDKPHLLLLPDLDDLSNVQEFYETEDGNGGWDARPEWIVWSNDGNELYVAAEKHGKALLWKLPSSPAAAKDLPEPIYSECSVIDAKTLGKSGSKLFVSSSSLVDSSCYSLLDPSSKSIELMSSSSKHGKSFGLSRKQCDDIWFKGAEGYDVHALVVRPSDFDPTKKYPLAFLIHGGPQGAWLDSWSTRWNPAIFAEQGYVAVMPNPTGSTGYGTYHTDAITEHWGGRPYIDLVRCWEHISKELPYVDLDRAVALGASYGGYMINWIQGHDLGRKFKALVCHDGVYSTQNMWSTEELFFPLHDFGGTLWENRAGYAKWDPSQHIGQWATPQLVIHNELDYRLPISEGLAMFNALQARGVPSRFLTFPDENHWVLKPENSLVWHHEVLSWINKYSGAGNRNDMACRGGK